MIKDVYLKDYVTMQQACDIMRISYATLQRLRKQKKTPEAVKFGGMLLLPRRWCESNKIPDGYVTLRTAVKGTGFTVQYLSERLYRGDDLTVIYRHFTGTKKPNIYICITDDKWKAFVQKHGKKPLAVCSPEEKSNTENADEH